ncbi:MAG: hypothetical protein ACXVCQ_13275 [Bacteriovorax sp.]
MLAGCTSLNFVAGEKTHFQIGADKNSEQVVEIKDSSDFYFWGKSPGTQRIDLEDFETKLGLNRPSFVTVSQRIGWKNFLLTAFTLGLYCPVDYEIKVLTAKGPLK